MQCTYANNVSDSALLDTTEHSQSCHDASVTQIHYLSDNLKICHFQTSRILPILP